MNILFDIFVVIALLCICFTGYFLYVVFCDALNTHVQYQKPLLTAFKEAFWYHFPRV